MEEEPSPIALAPEYIMNDNDQPGLLSPQTSLPILEGNTPHMDLNATLDESMMHDSSNPMDTGDTNFPPLPPSSAQREVGVTKPCLGKIRLTLGRKKPRVSDSAKRPQPSSPLIDRSSKRHTSIAVPPLGTPVLPTIQPTQDDCSSPSPPTNAQAKQPTFTFGRDFGLARNMPQPTDTIPDQSATAVENSAWDEILVDSPIVLPAHINTTMGASPIFNAASQWHETPNRMHNTPQKHGPNELNSLGLSNVNTHQQERRDEIYRDVKTDNNITTNAAGLQRTAIPNGGWPKIHLGIHPLENVTASQVESWKRVSTSKVWARLFRSKYEPNSLATVDRTRALLKNLVRVESDVALGVSFPLQEHATECDQFPPPYHMMISGLSERQIDHLISLEIVSTKDIMIIFKPFEDARPTFVMTIYGLTFVDLEEACSAVTTLIVNGIQDSEQVIKHIVECAPEQPDRVASDILNNISVKFLEVKRSKANGGDFRGWNVFLHHSYLTDDDHIKLIQLMRLCTFPSATAGFGLPLLGKDTLLCVSCKSIDHDTPNCPFPDLPGWLSYKPTQVPQGQTLQSAYNKEADCNTVNYHRGRGMGRGRGGGSVRGGRPYGRQAFRGHWN